MNYKSWIPFCLEVQDVMNMLLWQHLLYAQNVLDFYCNPMDSFPYVENVVLKLMLYQDLI